MSVVVLVIFSLFAQCVAATDIAVLDRSYLPLMQWQGVKRQPSEARTPEIASGIGRKRVQPSVASTSQADVRLLEDALLQKHGRLLGNSRSNAREMILRRYARNPQSAAQLRGIFAEAVYLDKHPNEAYVKKSNAPHNDVCRSGTFWKCAQIKTKKNFSGPGYAVEMKRDYRAKRFIVPDDHVQPLKNYFLEQAQVAEGAGNIKLADNTRRKIAKIRPLGETSEGLDNRLKSASHRVAAVKLSPYVSLGVATGLGVAPFLWDYANGDVTLDRVLEQASRDIALRGTAVGTEMTLAKAQKGALRGSLKGNLITGAAMFAVETGFLIYENGGTKAFREAVFWEEIGGSASALTLGLSIGIPVTIAVTEASVALGPAAPFVGAASGVMVGSLSSMAGYFGGKVVSRQILDNVAPEIARKAEQNAVMEVRMGLEDLKKKSSTMASI